MDVTKLPRLSDTKSAADAESAGGAVPPPPVDVTDRSRYAPRPAGVGVDVWISVIVGLLCLMLGGTFGRWAADRATGRPFVTDFFWPSGDPRAGQPVAYFELQGHPAWSDMAVFLFGVTLLAEAATKAAVAVRPSAVTRLGLAAAMVLTGATVLLNVGVAVVLYREGTIPQLCALAVAFGGWVLYDEWQTLQHNRPVRVGA